MFNNDSAEWLSNCECTFLFVISRNFDRFQSEIVRTNRLQLKLYERENLRSDLSYACSKSEIWLQFKRFLDRSFIEMTLLRHCTHTETCIVSHAMWFWWMLSTKTYVFLIYNTNFEKIQKKNLSTVRRFWLCCCCCWKYVLTQWIAVQMIWI